MYVSKKYVCVRVSVCVYESVSVRVNVIACVTIMWYDFIIINAFPDIIYAKTDTYSFIL